MDSSDEGPILSWFYQRKLSVECVTVHINLGLPLIARLVLGWGVDICCVALISLHGKSLF